MNQTFVKGQLAESLRELPGPVFICGGAYSGKSELAHLCLDQTLPAAVIGTSGTVPDERQQARIEELQAQRPNNWETFDTIVELPPLFAEVCEQHDQVLLDSVNQYIATALVNRLERYDRGQIEDQLALEVNHLMATFGSHKNKRIILVSSDPSAGIPPQRAPARAFRKIVSQANCLFASAAATVLDIRYGIPIQIK